MCLCEFLSCVEKYSTEMPSYFFTPFLFPLHSFPPLHFYSFCVMEIFMIDGMGLKAWTLCVSVGECFMSFIWKRGVQTSKWSCNLDALLFSSFLFFFSHWSLCMKKIRHHTTCIIFLSTVLIRYLACSLYFGPDYAKEFLSSYWAWVMLQRHLYYFRSHILLTPPDSPLLIPACRRKGYGTHDSYMWF